MPVSVSVQPLSCCLASASSWPDPAKMLADMSSGVIILYAISIHYNTSKIMIKRRTGLNRFWAMRGLYRCSDMHCTKFQLRQLRCWIQLSATNFLCSVMSLTKSRHAFKYSE